jgi:hypothetical protein
MSTCRRETASPIDDANGNNHGFFELHGDFRQIDVPGAGTTQAEGLNDPDDMVGIYTDLDGKQHGYAQSSDNFTTLNVPRAAVGSTLLLQINNSGTILGDYSDQQGLSHSFIANQQP